MASLKRQPQDPTSAEIDVVQQGLRPARSGKGMVYSPPISFSVGRVRFWVGPNRDGGFRARVFPLAAGRSRPIHVVEDASSERAAVSALICWARTHPQSDDGSSREGDASTAAPSRLRRFADRFQPTRSGTGLTYSPKEPVGRWWVRFWVGEGRRPYPTPAYVHRRSVDNGQVEHRRYYFLSPDAAYRAMLDWADRHGWGGRAAFPRGHSQSPGTSKGRRRRRAAPHRMPSPTRPVPGSLADDYRTPKEPPDASADWNGASERNDWDAHDWQRWIDKESDQRG